MPARRKTTTARPRRRPLRQLIDALQTALLTAQSVERNARDVSSESLELLNAIKRAGTSAHQLRLAGHDNGGEP
jgi:hypothetical protein